tara:strand:+ start:34 stop:417 length:384 start_codon:yes stop_codon:yes gene_type:complete
MSTLKTGTVQNNTGTGAPLFKNNAGTEIGQLAKAWVNFDGTGTLAVSDDFNVSSVTDNGTGNYTVNFTTNMSNANYAVAVSSYMTGSNSYAAYERLDSFTTSSFLIRTVHSSSFQDISLVCAAVFGA